MVSCKITLNPFNPTTKISYSLPKEIFITLKVYDILSNEIATLVEDEKSAGNYIINFSVIDGSDSGGDAYNLPNGVYFYRIQAGNFIDLKIYPASLKTSQDRSCCANLNK